MRRFMLNLDHWLYKIALFFFSMNGSTLHPKRTFIQRIRFSFFVIIDLESIPITGQNSQFSQKLITCIKSTISDKFQSPDLPAKGKTINVLSKEEHIIKRSKDYFEEVFKKHRRSSKRSSNNTDCENFG